MKLAKIALGLLGLLIFVAPIWAQDAAPAPAPAVAPEPGPTIILNDFASWRTFSQLKPPEIAFDDGVKPAVFKVSENYWLNGETSLAPADWTKADFNDSEWLRGPLGMSSHSPWTARSYARGKFNVTDPAKAKSLKLSVSYHGGIAVYLNGQEIGRKDVKADANLADAYPTDAFVNAAGAILGSFDPFAEKKPDADSIQRMNSRERSLEIVLPEKFLRKGVNVIALEAVRTPYDKVVDAKKLLCWDKEPMYPMPWYTCELRSVTLATEVPAGVEPNVARPAGLQAWNSTLARADFVLDRGDACEKVQPISITATRNGIFSGKVIVGSANAIKALKAVPSELKGPGVIPVSAMRVRYAIAGESEYGIYNTAFGQPLPAGARSVPFASAFSILMDAPPAEYRVAGSGDVAGAVAPVWLTVDVPENAKPGSYSGKLVVTVEGEKPLEFTVEIKVADWKLPQPDKFQTWTEIIESPDTLKLEYDVPAWSDKHFELIGRSFHLMSEVGSKVVYVPLICCTNMGNEESMVRWIKKGENDYDFDFTVFDRYMDTAEKNLGKPELVCFITWEIFMLPSKDLSVGGAHSDIPGVISKYKDRMTNPWVTTVDPATGKIDRVEFPNYFTDENCKKNWGKLFTQLRERMKKRDLEKSMMLGWFTDVRAQRGELDFWKEITNDLPWVSHAHFFVGGGINIGYCTIIHDAKHPQDPAKGHSYGWQKKPMIYAQQLLRPGWRGEMDMLPGSTWGAMTEITVSGGQRGFGRLGGDAWFVLKDKAGRRVGRIYDRYPWTVWSNLELCCSLFAPGPDGAVPTAHFEQLREGVQETEARIFIEQALVDKDKRAKLGDELAQRVQATLDERMIYNLRGVANYTTSTHAYVSPFMWWFQVGAAGHAWKQSTDCEDRNLKLYSAAGEVAAKLGGN